MEDDRISIHQIVAIDENGGIGLNGDLPWKLQKDWQHFLRMTTKVKSDRYPYVCWILGRSSFEKHAKQGALFDTIEKESKIKIIAIIMSRQWKAIPEVYSRNNNTYLCKDFHEVVGLLRGPDFIEKFEVAWNLGGPGIYREHLEYLQKHPENASNSRIYMTKIYKTFQSDAFYPMKTWNQTKQQFRELDVCEDVPDLGNVIKEKEDISISFHVYESKNC